MKTMNGFKVLYAQTRGSSNHVIPEGISCIYPVNVWVFPTIKQSKLFFFKQFEDASTFCGMGNDGEYKIVPCIAKNPQRLIFASVVWANYEMFWKLKARKISTFGISVEVYKGTYVADSIKCLE